MQTVEFLAETKNILDIFTPRVAVLVTFGMVLLAVVKSLPLLTRQTSKMHSITKVLIVFFMILGVAITGQFILYWQGLKTNEEKNAFLNLCVYGTLLFALMVGGMFSKYFWELFQTGKNLGDADLKLLLAPLLISLMVFYPIWTITSGSPKGIFPIVAAFQNGFFWQTVFSGLKPFTGKP